MFFFQDLALGIEELVISGELPAAINGAAAPGDSLAAGPLPMAL